jgi:predicted DNA-binding transcriptional regulator AlpA
MFRLVRCHAPPAVSTSTFDIVAELIDPDDLVDSSGVAAILGLASRTTITIYRSRYPDFPQPAVQRGQCRLWLASEVAAWAEHRQRSSRR